jgi:hypothetical protein
MFDGFYARCVLLLGKNYTFLLKKNLYLNGFPGSFVYALGIQVLLMQQ